MLSRNLQRIATVGTRSFASSRDPTLKYDFQVAEQKDHGKMMDLLVNDFVYTEPHSVALGLNKDSGRNIFDWILSKSLHYPYSMTIAEKASGKIIGFRLMSVAHRDETKNFEPFDLDIEKEEEGVQILAIILENLKGEIWKLRPEANAILRREITFVNRNHQRQGIAQRLLHLNLDFDLLRARGIDGIQSEASSYANQQLLKKNGYQKLLESQRKEYVRSNGEPVIFGDETKNIQLYYFNLKK